MLKKLLKCTIFFISYNTLAAESLDLYQAPVSSLKQFPLMQKANKSMLKKALSSADANGLQEVNVTEENSKIITRYQQMYQGIPIVGAQIMITKEAITGSNAQVNGHLLNDIQLDAHPALSSQEALDLAKKTWFSFYPQSPIIEEQVELQIRSEQNNQLKLVYLVSFKGNEDNDKPAWPFYVIDAQKGEIIKQWNNIKNYSDNGPGGNDKVHEYWYGKNGLPPLEVHQRNATCTMESNKVKLVNLGSAWDWNGTLLNPFQYTCNNNKEERINGAFSPTNDAYFFGQVIVDMYRDWYQVHALQNSNGNPMQLVMRVHFGEFFDNAFWDGRSMSFGDGKDFYPLVSLDIAGHEVTHGFTEQHSNLEYHDQSGALNESVSDMAGQATRAYLLEKSPQLYNKMYLEPNVVTWGIGETVVRDSFGKALRFMDIPSSDGYSADCVSKEMAQSHGAYCAINYSDVVAFANSHISNPQDRQNFIVHTGSGVFNKAFYLLAKKIGIKKAYQIMIIANSKYWTPSTNFTQGACGVLYGASDLKIDINLIKTIFGQVGVSTITCAM